MTNEVSGTSSNKKGSTEKTQPSASVFHLVSKGAPIKVPISIDYPIARIEIMGIANISDVNSKTTGQPSHIQPLDQVTPALFNDLWLGDRFEILNDPSVAGDIFTKTRHDQARKHSKESRKLRAEGLGYIDDPIVSVAQNRIVRFIPVR